MYVFRQTLFRESAMNLALEEILLHTVDDDLFMLWQDAPCVVIGRGQNARAEVNLSYLEQNDIALVRRMSGGGAVYHDAGNLCYTFIDTAPGRKMGNHTPYIDQVVAALRRMGIPAMREGRNDISVNGKKVSGNAQYAWRDRLCHHGTLLFNVDMDALMAVLTPDAAKLSGKGVPSVAARVTNLEDFLPGTTIDDFADALLLDMLRNIPEARLFTPSESILAEAERLAVRYRDPSLIWGAVFPYDFRNERRFPGGKVEVYLRVENGAILDAALYGDFLTMVDFTPLTLALRGVPHERPAIRQALSAMYCEGMLGSISLEDLISLF